MHDIPISSPAPLKFRMLRMLARVRQTITQKFTLRFALIDWFLLNLSFLLMNYAKRDSVFLSVRYFKLLLLFNGAWLLIGLLTKKFSLHRYSGLTSAFINLGKAVLFKIYLVSIVVVAMRLYAFSRVQIFSTAFLFFLLEMAVIAVVFRIVGDNYFETEQTDSGRRARFKNISISIMLSDGLFLVAGFYALNYFKRGTFELPVDYDAILFGMTALWLLTGFMTRKFEIRRHRNIYYAFTPFFKALLLNTAMMALVMFAFRLFEYSRLQVLGAFGAAFVLESVFFLVYFRLKMNDTAVQDIETADGVRSMIGQENQPFELEMIREAGLQNIEPVQTELRDRYLAERPEVYQLLQRALDLKAIDRNYATVLSTHTMYNVEVLEDHSLRLFLNLQRLNDVRYLNRYFLEIHRKIFNGGFLVGAVQTIKTHRKVFFEKFPWPVAQILYPLHFIFKRVMPKLPFFKNIYFIVTRGKKRVLSKTEVFGRLYFCGFRIIDEQEIDGELFFVAQRVKNPSPERNPSYGPTIKLKRVGYKGELLYVSKFRTMHPYSEFLQEYIYEHNRLQQSGKFKNDFRVTTWGKVMRRLWIDELPQLMNYIRGDLNLVGVRALSRHYFGLYPEDLQQLRIQFKPGLVPPYYADMPENFDQIVDSERRYLELKQKHPVTTDFRYFFMAFYNILFKKARSG